LFGKIKIHIGKREEMHIRFISMKRLSSLVLIVFMFSFLGCAQTSYGMSDFETKLHNLGSRVFGLKVSIDKQRKATRAKINELKLREKIEISKLYKSQDKLEATKNDIEYCNTKLNVAKNKLSGLQSQLSVVSASQATSERRAGERIKQIYKGERISLLHLIFAAKDINTFFDRVYYQKRLATYDKEVLADLRVQTNRLIETRHGIESQQNNILNTLGVMNHKKREIAASISTSQYLINKLRTDRATYEAAERDLARQSDAITNMLARSLRKPDVKIHTTGGFMRPLMGIITSPFGWRRHPIFGSRSFHTGVDISSSYSTPIHASNSGKVVYTGWYGGYGKVVIINHGQYHGTGTSTLYAHLCASCVGVGQYIKQGQVVGYEGTTGYSTGPHLHFEVRLNGKPTNPLNYIR
jgi:murein DD-endopeptidase MepM/ murein hydrolase activator NlpD